jgi:hypothetical protein
MITEFNRVSRRTTLIGLVAAFAGAFSRRARSAPSSYDIAIYGATPSGIIAAHTAAQYGQRVALIEGFTGFGGMVAGGLGHTDLAHPTLVGGNTLRFFEQIGRHYGMTGPGWRVEPHVARSIFLKMLESGDIDIHYARLKETGGVSKTGAQITGIVLENGTAIHAKQFVDASYEGDLMAQAGVAYVVGRESSAAYGEPLAGFNRFPSLLSSPPRDGNGKLFPGVSPQSAMIAQGSADRSVMSYGYRLCLSNIRSNIVPFAKPAGYDETRFHVFKASILHGFKDYFHPVPLPNGKFDLNFDSIIGGSLKYPEASYAGRERIALANKAYQQGCIWLMATDSGVPAALRAQVNDYGLAADEFDATGHWPDRAFYLREGRRLVGEYVFRQQDTQTTVSKPDPVGMGGWYVDCHTCGVYEYEGKILFEGFIDETDSNGAADTKPFQFPYRSIVPKAAQATNLWVSCCHSSSHIGYQPARIEWIYMTLGEAAGTAAAIANLDRATAQSVPYSALAGKLKANGGVLSR